MFYLSMIQQGNIWKCNIDQTGMYLVYNGCVHKNNVAVFWTKHTYTKIAKKIFNKWNTYLRWNYGIVFVC